MESGPTLSNVCIAVGLLLLGGVICARLAERLRVPRLTALMFVGIVLGAPAVGLVTPEVKTWLGVVERVAGSVIAFSVGALVNWKDARSSAKPLARFVLSTLLVVVPVCALAASWALPALGLGSGVKIVAVLALTLAAVSPTVVVAVADELGAEGPLTRTALASVIVLDFALLVLLIVLSALTGLTEPSSSGVVALARSLGGAVAVGLVFGLVLERLRRVAGVAIIAVVAIAAFVVAAKLSDGPVTWLAASIAAGMVASSSAGDAAEDVVKIARASLPIAAVLLFGIEGLLLDVRRLASFLLPVVVLVLARAAGIWLGARAGFAPREANPSIRRWAFAAFLPQAGFALALIALLPSLFPSFGESVRALAVGVVALNELLMPPVLRHALAAAGEAGALRSLAAQNR